MARGQTSRGRRGRGRARADRRLRPRHRSTRTGWKALLQQAEEGIDLLDFTLISILGQSGIPELLKTKAQAGCRVRLLISCLSRARLATDTPLDQPYPDDEPVEAFEIARSRGYIQQLLDTPGIQARKFAAMRFNSIIRADEQMLVTLHLWGTPAANAPLIHLRARDHPGLFEQLENH